MNFRSPGCKCCGAPAKDCLIKDLRPSDLWVEEWDDPFNIFDPPNEDRDDIPEGTSVSVTWPAPNAWAVRLEVAGFGDMAVEATASIGAFWSDGFNSVSISLDKDFKEYPRVVVDTQYRCIEQYLADPFEILFYREVGSNENGDYIDLSTTLNLLIRDEDDNPIEIVSTCRRVYVKEDVSDVTITINSGNQNPISMGQVQLYENGSAVNNCPQSPCYDQGVICPPSGKYAICTGLRWEISGFISGAGDGYGQNVFDPFCEKTETWSTTNSDVNGTYYWPLHRTNNAGTGKPLGELTPEETQEIIDKTLYGGECWDDGDQYRWQGTINDPILYIYYRYIRIGDPTPGCLGDVDQQQIVSFWQGLRGADGQDGCSLQDIWGATSGNRFDNVNMKLGCDPEPVELVEEWAGNQVATSWNFFGYDYTVNDQRGPAYIRSFLEIAWR